MINLSTLQAVANGKLAVTLDEFEDVETVSSVETGQPVAYELLLEVGSLWTEGLVVRTEQLTENGAYVIKFV